MSAFAFPTDPLSTKILQLKAQFDGRETLTVNEVLHLLKISRMTAYLLAKRGNFIPVTRIGRNIRYTIDNTAAYLLALGNQSAQAVAPTKQTQPDAPKKTGRPRKQRSATRGK